MKLSENLSVDGQGIRKRIYTDDQGIRMCNCRWQMDQKAYISIVTVSGNVYTDGQGSNKVSAILKPGAVQNVAFG
jgi:hypothetical protein